MMLRDIARHCVELAKELYEARRRWADNHGDRRPFELPEDTWSKLVEVGYQMDRALAELEAGPSVTLANCPLCRCRTIVEDGGKVSHDTPYCKLNGKHNSAIAWNAAVRDEANSMVLTAALASEVGES